MPFSPTVIIVAAISLFAILTCGLIVSRMVQRASKEVSYVRTGFRGQKVIQNGWALVFPVLHETIPVNMNTIRLEVMRHAAQALITKDRMRVDVTAEFYVRVQPTAESIANAAQTLGQRTMNQEALKELVEGKFVDALRAVAAEMAMEELHEQRVNFVQKVQTAVSEDLLKNGLELESVSLTGLDQTSREFFNPQNAFDAEGLTRLTEQIETRRKQRNDIEQDTEVLVQSKNLEAERQKLEIGKEEEYARLRQQREIEIRRANQAAEIAQERAVKAQIAKQAEIAAKQQVDVSAIEAERVTEEQRIAKDRLIKETDIGKDRAIEVAEIQRKKTVELSEQDKDIAVANKSQSQSEAQAEADRARALAVQAEEQVTTMREAETAERVKRIELIRAAEKAERDAIAITVSADADKRASDDRAAAARLIANGDADAERIRADAAERTFAVNAEGKRALHAADNILSQEQVAMAIKLAIIKAMPEIVRESVKPLEQIEGIKIMQVAGLGANGGASATGNGASASTGGAGTSAGGGKGNLADEVVRSALQYRAQAPLVDSLLGELGLKGGGDTIDLTDALTSIDGSAVMGGVNGTNGTSPNGGSTPE
jgi:uncharacterized membrane protein YqiK